MAMIETRSIDYVPLAERRGEVRHLWPVWFTGDAHLATLATGAISVAGGLAAKYPNNRLCRCTHPAID